MNIVLYDLNDNRNSKIRQKSWKQRLQKYERDGKELSGGKNEQKNDKERD